MQVVIRIAVFLELEVYKAQVERSLVLQRRTLNCLTWFYLVLDPDFPGDKELESERKVLVAGAAKFLDWPIADDMAAEVAEHDSLVDQIAERLAKNEDARKLKATRILAEAYSEGLIDEIDSERKAQRAERVDRLLSEARKLDSDSQLLDKKTLRSKIKAVEKQAYTLRKAYRHGRTPKISLDPKDVTFTLSLMSTLFLVSGYVHTRLLLSRFGIDASDFFSLTDYLAASLDEIQEAIALAMFGILGLWIGYVRHERLTGDEKKVESARSDTPFNFMMFVSAVGYVLAYLQTDVRLMLITGVTLLFLLIFIKLAPAISRYFERPSPIVVLFSTYWIGAFLFSLIQSPITTALDIKDADSVPTKSYAIELADGSVLSEGFVPITANSTYFFVFDRASQEATAIPKGRVASVTPVIPIDRKERDASGRQESGSPDQAADDTEITGKK